MRHLFQHVVYWALIAALSGGALPSSLVAKETPDQVVVRADKKSPAVTRSGNIQDYTGRELRLETVSGRVETIPAERIVEIRTKKTELQKQAESLFAEDRLDAAIGAYKQAKQQESRPWMVRQISAQLVSCYLEQQAIELAGDEFLSILASDPDPIHWDVIPLPWRLQATPPSLETKARVWLQREKQPAAVLLGASWLVGSTDRTLALQTLQQLASGNEKTIALLAETQLWRTKLVTANEAEVIRWQEMWERYPEPLRPTATFILADGYSRVNRPATAAALFLQLPILAPQQRGAAADGLLAAGKQLEKQGQQVEAAGLYRELSERYASSPSAAEARARLAQLTPPSKDRKP